MEIRVALQSTNETLRVLKVCVRVRERERKREPPQPLTTTNLTQLNTKPKIKIPSHQHLCVRIVYIIFSRLHKVRAGSYFHLKPSFFARCSQLCARKQLAGFWGVAQRARRGHFSGALNLPFLLLNVYAKPVS